MIVAAVVNDKKWRHIFALISLRLCIYGGHGTERRSKQCDLVERKMCCSLCLSPEVQQIECALMHNASDLSVTVDHEHILIVQGLISAHRTHACRAQVRSKHFQTDKVGTEESCSRTVPLWFELVFTSGLPVGTHMCNRGPLRISSHFSIMLQICCCLKPANQQYQLTKLLCQKR